MLAFAANSLLCRLALGAELIDAASFMAIRVISGAIMLGLIILPRYRTQGRLEPNWWAIAALFVYMIGFSLAYLSLAAGTGALILFGAVQLTMISVALKSGERFSLVSWIGLAIAIAGLVYLVSPGITAPDPAGALLMAIAGIGWGWYSLLGRSASDPLESTAYNFIYLVPLVALTSLAFVADFHVTPAGIGLAVASGSVASGLGYFVWYAALRDLTAIRAATVQLSVPVIAAFGGVLLLSEDVSQRLVIASVATLGGVAIVLSRKAAASSHPDD